MNSVIKNLRNKSMRTYTYSDCDGGNNRGVELNELKFAELIIKEAYRVVRSKADRWGNITDEMVNEAIIEAADHMLKHFGVNNETKK